MEKRARPEAAKKVAVATVRNNDWPNYQTDTEKLNIVGVHQDCNPTDRVLFAGRVLKDAGPPAVYRYYRIVFIYKNAVVRLWNDPSLDVDDMIDMEAVGNVIQKELWD